MPCPLGHDFSPAMGRWPEYTTGTCAKFIENRRNRVLSKGSRKSRRTAAVRALDSRRDFLSDAQLSAASASVPPEPHESLREQNMTVAPEASELNLSMEEAAILDAALGDGTGEFVIVRPYGKAWGADHAMVKRLEARGFMRFKCDGRAPQTRDYLRTSSITDSGRAAAGRVAHVAT